MKKLLVVLFVLFLLSLPVLAQANSDETCTSDDPTCTASGDDGRQTYGRDNDDGDDDDQDDDDREGRNKDKDDGDRHDRDDDDRGDDDRGKRDKDKDDRDKRDRDDDHDDCEDRDRDDGDDRCKKDKDKKDKDRRDRDGDDDDGDDPDQDDGDDDDDDDDCEDCDRDDDDDDDGDEPDDDEGDSDDKPKKGACRTIREGGIFTSGGDEIVMGYDVWGYNYQAHKFNGWWENAGRTGTPVERGNIRFKMKWNDVYISNKDCDGDGLLDRHYGYDSYYGTRAWLTNKYMWSYVGDEGNVHWVHWFLKMVAQPYAGFDCASIGGTTFNGQFCTVKNVYYDPYGGSQGMTALMDGLGFGGK